MLVIPQVHYDNLLICAQENESEEVCGILSGTYGSSVSSVENIIPVENIATNPSNRYRIDPEELLHHIEEIETHGRDVVGFFHSHPHRPPHPSETDREQATWDGYSYLIINLEGETSIGSWRWDADEVRFRAEQLSISST